MIHGAHVIIYSKDAEADRAFFKDTLKYRFADAGHGWLIFALPPAEVAVHPSESGGSQELYLMCDDVEAFVAEMAKKNVACGAVSEQPWGLLTQLTLPGGGTLGVYQPRHASPIAKAKKRKTSAAKPRKKKSAPAAKKKTKAKRR